MLNFFGSSCFSAAISKKTACTSFSPVQTALSFSVFVFLFACFYIAALLVRADQLIAFFQHIAAAFLQCSGRRRLADRQKESGGSENQSRRNLEMTREDGGSTTAFFLLPSSGRL